MRNHPATLGIDIGGTSVKAALLDHGTPLWTSQSPFYARPDSSTLIGAIANAVGELHESIDTVGICVPGLLDADKRRVTKSVNVPGLMELSLLELVRASSPHLVEANLKVVTDAFSCASDVIASMKLTGRVLTIALGTGVGASVVDVIDGQLSPLRISGESPGHFGQLDVSLTDDAPIGPDGGRGSLEAYIGVPALRRDYNNDIASAIASFNIDSPALNALARAIRIAHSIYRPDHVVLAGGIGTRLRPHLSTIRELVDRDLTSVARPGRTLSCAIDDFHAARGAARLAM
jgi:predicted NBD/HSP70 family sugar kinase